MKQEGVNTPEQEGRPISKSSTHNIEMLAYSSG